MIPYRILFLGDVVGRPGREAVSKHLPVLVSEFDPLFTVVNGENSAAGLGITPEIADAFFKDGVDAITLGNHAYNKREIYPYLASNRPIVRPANLPRQAPGRGYCVVSKGGVSLAIVNLCGRVFLDGYDDPFALIDEILPTLGTPHVLIDFHAEATSEKVAFAHHVDGRVTTVLGTHTHVQTADERVLPEGTSTITDVGMCGPMPSVIGFDIDGILYRFRTSLPTRFEVAEKPGVISAVVIDVDPESAKSVSIRRVQRP